mmetsp:Transcript_24855/g.37772  ORF Transcript_24855/g.37772 Transcript_24855/m.37772 type:complete len:204 (+) Transcript_24855:164-775(+)|eukprot:CAMPEP_0178916610 /NCGR_PEP_ID=MMETSP0786-20121207/12751_1 /TAXON_ID=186022 /ORGANISM="Thalassionema frauenfeldii, Strain CCMP 1798" /LENGTH=203 /DNA_ID=CAMNT_0020589997 /DNA_START=109 /DNA_END=720 /DNA_ORIENTATION=-
MSKLCSPIKCIPIALGWEKGTNPERADHSKDDFTVTTVLSDNNSVGESEEQSRTCCEMMRRCFSSSSKPKGDGNDNEPTTKDETKIQPPVLEPELDLAYVGETIRWQADNEEEEKERSSFCFICLEDFAGDPKIVKSKCSRTYHQRCMLDHVKSKNNSCPDCKASIWDHIEFEGIQQQCKTMPAYSGNLHNLRAPIIANNIRY